MKIRHRVPTEALAYRPEPISERYQAEVDTATERSERDALRQLQVAERRLARLVQVAKPKTHALKVAIELVEIRRQELLAIQRSMQSVPASSAHRSRAGHRPIPAQKTL